MLIFGQFNATMLFLVIAWARLLPEIRSRAVPLTMSWAERHKRHWTGRCGVICFDSHIADWGMPISSSRAYAKSESGWLCPSQSIPEFGTREGAKFSLLCGFTTSSQFKCRSRQISARESTITCPSERGKRLDQAMSCTFVSIKIEDMGCDRAHVSQD